MKTIGYLSLGLVLALYGAEAALRTYQFLKRRWTNNRGRQYIATLGLSKG